MRRELSGFRLAVRSSVPLGSGLSSSAALLVTTLRAIRRAFALPLDDVEIAVIAWRAETDFVGAPVGIMNQMACSLGDTQTAVFLDTRSLEYERVPIPPSMELLVIDSGVAHAHATGEYRARKGECEQAAALLGVAELRDAGLGQLASLPPLLERRARHVVTENARVLAAVRALRTDDPADLGRLFAASHASLRDDYQVSVPEVDALVEAAGAQLHVYGARLTGGGFGGAIVAAVEAGWAAIAGEKIRLEYQRRLGRVATVLMPSPR